MGKVILTLLFYLITFNSTAQDTHRDSLVYKYFDFKSRIYGDDIDPQVVSLLLKNKTTFIVDTSYEYIQKEVVLDANSQFTFRLDLNKFQAQFDTLVLNYNVAYHYDDSDQSDITLVMDMHDDRDKESFSYDLFYLDEKYMILRESWRIRKKKIKAKRIILLQLSE